MRMRLGFAIIIGFLFCTLATLELPELVNLVDDPSNDFSLVVFTKNALSAVKAQIVPQGRRILADVQRPQVTAYSAARSLKLTFQTSSDLLHILCTQRT